MLNKVTINYICWNLNKTNALFRKGGSIMFNKFGKNNHNQFNQLFNRKVISGVYCI